ncbi:hypothetical protein [Litoreibacter albidus]|uniref:Uncharacterized protein n=1 Tax=Litoreibacter albidus TaxID=670155 RepID=A0A1H2ZGR0_9RHOB|nr:hypothetical protein [Litoreibacter albidus]SDX16640.1 hypothetical protein SAMN04488001_2577 [Litoreibacter albidus]
MVNHTTTRKSVSIAVMNAGHLSRRVDAPVAVSGVVQTQAYLASEGN